MNTPTSHRAKQQEYNFEYLSIEKLWDNPALKLYLQQTCLEQNNSLLAVAYEFVENVDKCRVKMRDAKNQSLRSLIDSYFGNNYDASHPMCAAVGKHFCEEMVQASQQEQQETFSYLLDTLYKQMFHFIKQHGLTKLLLQSKKKQQFSKQVKQESNCLDISPHNSLLFAVNSKIHLCKAWYAPSSITVDHIAMLQILCEEHSISLWRVLQQKWSSSKTEYSILYESIPKFHLINKEETVVFPQVFSSNCKLYKLSGLIQSSTISLFEWLYVNQTFANAVESTSEYHQKDGIGFTTCRELFGRDQLMTCSAAFAHQKDYYFIKLAEEKESKYLVGWQVQSITENLSHFSLVICSNVKSWNTVLYQWMKNIASNCTLSYSSTASIPSHLWNKISL